MAVTISIKTTADTTNASKTIDSFIKTSNAKTITLKAKLSPDTKAIIQNAIDSKKFQINEISVKTSVIKSQLQAFQKEYNQSGMQIKAVLSDTTKGTLENAIKKVPLTLDAKVNEKNLLTQLKQVQKDFNANGGFIFEIKANVKDSTIKRTISQYKEELSEIERQYQATQAGGGNYNEQLVSFNQYIAEKRRINDEYYTNDDINKTQWSNTEKQILQQISSENTKNFEIRKKEAQELNKINEQNAKSETERLHQNILSQNTYANTKISLQERVNTGNLGELQMLEKLREENETLYSRGIIGQEEYVKNQSDITKKLDNYSSSLTNATKNQKSLAEQIGLTVANFLKFQIVSKLAQVATQALESMVTSVINLDKELTEFSKVSDLSNKQMEEFVGSAYALGEQVARTGTEAVTATTLFKKMGYSVEESLGFAKDALMWQNVADGLVTVDDASTMIISNLKAFNKEGLTSTHIIDSLNEVNI